MEPATAAQATMQEAIGCVERRSRLPAHASRSASDVLIDFFAITCKQCGVSVSRD